MVINLNEEMYIKREYKIGNKEKLSIANNFIHSYYGQFLYTDKIDGDSFFINASLPYEILDNNKKLLRFDNYEHIAEIKIKINEPLIKFTGLNYMRIEKNIDGEKTNKINESERLLFKISQNKFSELPAASVFYMPIKEIITEVYNNGTMEIRDKTSNKKLIKYAKFLEQLNIIKITDEHDTYKFVIGETAKKVERNSENPVMSLFNYSLIHGYDYLYRKIGIRSLSPYLKIANSLYYNVSKLRKNIEVNETELNKYYNNMYRTRMEDYKFNVYLDSLSDVKIIHKENNIVTGNWEITEKLIKA